jgi:DNA polymerase I-like protein with 3'-5' exonuclease and polymerase domains
VDIETCDPQLTELGPGVRRGAFIAGVSFAVEDGPSFYLPIAHEGGDNLPREHVLQYLRDQAAAFRGTIVGMNLPYDLDFLAEERIVFREAQFRDVSVAACLINELHDSYSLEAILGRAGLPGKSEAGLERAARAWGLGKYVEKKFRVKEDLWRLPARHVAEYAISDVELPLLLLRRQEREIEKQDLGQIWDLESRVLPVCVKMRRRGIRVDLQRLDQVETWLHGEEVLALGKVDHLTGVKIPPKDLLKKALVVRAFDAIGVKLPRTPTGQPKLTADVLRGIDHPVARELLRAKKLHKIRCDFVSSVRRHEVGGRIHPTFRSVKGAADGWKDDSEGAAYGRFAGSHPNLQQQPNPEKDPEISGVWRQIYLPDEGKVLAAIDYSAQEPRMLVHYAALTNCPGGREMAACYQENPRLDLHQATADLCEIARKPAKIIFLGKVYGMGGAKLCDSLGLPTEWWQPPTGKKVRVAGPEGRALIEAFNRLAPFVQRMSQGTETRARKAGYIRTILGRHCRFPRNPLKPNEYEWTHKALNRLIQGSSADQTKQAMVDAEAAGYKIQLPVHDELVLSVSDRAEAEEVGRIMCEAVPLLVPSMVDVAIGPNWGEVKE